MAHSRQNENNPQRMGEAPPINGRIAAAPGAAPVGDFGRSTLGREGTVWPTGGPAMEGRAQAYRSLKLN